ncbi:Oidioi.mRNA.OKI2018_I69.chr1.g3859.t1.cds [Oikopleura dioica]|uniref:Oidioi.mRNA.OKI2018_I69.chr1.g3859.t1.cds n=1 Tax=Oikopleura dioica TaxID=34765 RepID=A0ABN7T0Z2_OIKDI|nr:Oidioi.mRNA.OKI2018_I69.chr1.g3859.t1.cds [Oikopleura dioica]
MRGFFVLFNLIYLGNCSAIFDRATSGHFEPAHQKRRALTDLIMNPWMEEHLLETSHNHHSSIRQLEDFFSTLFS